MTEKITPCFYFDGNAEEAVTFYVSLLKNSRVIETTYYGPGAPMPQGAVMTIQFELQGRRFMAINGGPDFKFSPAISMVVYCETQEELDHLWDSLSAGGATMACGWLADRFGISWQIVAPRQFDAPKPLFCSDRERRLWGWTLAVVVAIYATLGLASTLAGALPDGLAAVGFLVAMLLVGLTILTQGLPHRLPKTQATGAPAFTPD